MRRCVLLPSYNSGPLLVRTAREALDHWPDVWVVLDGSSDASGPGILSLAAAHPGLRVLRLPVNRGKGAAVVAGMKAAGSFSHVLVMDADGQHPADRIPEFMALSERHPSAMILGVPIFDAEAPPERVWGRKVGNSLALLETLGVGPRDALFGFRLYPAGPALRVMAETHGGRRFDFDTEIAVRLVWAGVRPIHREVPVRYPARAKGGVTHFRYVGDNLLLARAHTRLCFEALRRLPGLLRLRREWKSQPELS